MTRNVIRTKVEVIVFDFDGVLTDNRVLVLEDGSEAVFCNRSDGLFIEHLKRQSYRMFILSKEKNIVVSARARKLGIQSIQGVNNKVEALLEICRDAQTDPAKAAYIGNDVNDLAVMQIVGMPIAVADAHPSVKAAADYVLETRGGAGIVRELCESILGEPWVPDEK